MSGLLGRVAPHGKVIMITEQTIEGFITLAGPDFSWAGVRGCGRPPSSYMGRKGIRQALRLDLIARQGGICFACGEVLDDTAEFCHIVSRGPGIRGWLWGNVAIGHAVCNEAQKQRGPIVHMSDMARPDVVPTEWTPYRLLGM